MPNPIAHPAAAVPFTRAGLVLSALVIGSVSPDFGYLIPVSNAYFMYTIPGLILFDVPVGLALLWVFHIFGKWPLLSIAPDGLQRRLVMPARGFSFGPRRRFGLILLSLLVGSVTHVLWDSFTHEWGWFVEHSAFLRVPVVGMPAYEVLQNVGTLLGVCLLAYWFVRWWPTATESDRLPAGFSPKIRTLALVLAALSLAAAEVVTVYSRFASGVHIVHAHGVIHGMTLVAVLTLSFYAAVYCLAWVVAFRKTLSSK